MPEKIKRDRRDRSDRIYVRNQDALHIIMPYNMPGRTRNEAVLSEIIDIERIKEYVDKKNESNPEYKYTWFQVITAAIAKTIYLRPKMNYFISGRKLFERREIQTAFIVKRSFDDHSEESCAKWILDKQGGAPIEQLHNFLYSFVTKVRVKRQKEGASSKMDIIKIMPGFMIALFFWVLKMLESIGYYPKQFQYDDPCYSTVFVSNLGSIKMDANYHHIFEWGTNSFFVVISEMKKRLLVNPDGSTDIKDTIRLSLTIDERIADGYYFAKSIALLKYILQNPELLDEDVSTPVNFEY